MGRITDTTTNLDTNLIVSAESLPAVTNSHPVTATDDSRFRHIERTLNDFQLHGQELSDQCDIRCEESQDETSFHSILHLIQKTGTQFLSGTQKEKKLSEGKTSTQIPTETFSEYPNRRILSVSIMRGDLNQMKD